MKRGANELLDGYLESTAEFSTMLNNRTPGEIAYDNEVVAGLRKGFAITKSLELAGEKYPIEALQWDENTIAEIKDHYEYLMNHQDILSKIESLSSKR
jgi:hypothetical protein